MTTLRQTAIGALVALACSGAALVTAQSTRHASGEAGVAYPSRTDMRCFSALYGEMKNTCFEEKTLDFMLAIDSAGTKTVTVRTYWNTNWGTMRCRAYAVSASGAGIGGASVTVDPGRDTETLPWVVVPNNGALGATCNVPYGSSVGSLTWDR
jgi:hypothetical protein